ncbi:MAG: class I mannose-6-phosphate isomerase [Hyphomicrobium sp.]
MAVEHATVQVTRKPWGVCDLRPWSRIDVAGDPVGELWFQRPNEHAAAPALLLKLIFAREPLSIQVHPDDAFARSIGLPNGKTEAWYILAADPGARVSLGLNRRLTPQALGAAIRDGSIADLVHWRAVAEGDTIFVPAGTIHAIGAGIVLAEIQQRSDTTFRLFDHGRQRELHEKSAVAASNAGPVQPQLAPQSITKVRTALITSQHFTVELINLPANSNWTLSADRETWILAVEGWARVGMTSVSIGNAVFIEDDQARIKVGTDCMRALVAYPGPDPVVSLLEDAGGLTKSVGMSAGDLVNSNETAEVTI